MNTETAVGATAIDWGSGWALYAAASGADLITTTRAMGPADVAMGAAASNTRGRSPFGSAPSPDAGAASNFNISSIGVARLRSASFPAK